MHHPIGYYLNDHKGELTMPSYIFYYSLFKINGELMLILSAICSLVSLFITTYSCMYFIAPQIKFVNFFYVWLCYIVYFIFCHVVLSVSLFLSLCILWFLFLTPFAIYNFNTKYKRYF